MRRPHLELRSFTAPVLVAFALLASACAPRVEAPRVDDSDYVFPELKRGELNSRDEKALRSAWNDVLVGQVQRAEQTVARILSSRPDLLMT